MSPTNDSTNQSYEIYANQSGQNDVMNLTEQILICCHYWYANVNYYHLKLHTWSLSLSLSLFLSLSLSLSHTHTHKIN